VLLHFFLVSMPCMGAHTEAAKIEAASMGPIQTVSFYRRKWYSTGRYAFPRKSWERGQYRKRIKQGLGIPPDSNIVMGTIEPYSFSLERIEYRLGSVLRRNDVKKLSRNGIAQLRLEGVPKECNLFV
jgi:hypothetical protein